MPDIIVANAPNEKALNEDSQLKKVVETLLQRRYKGSANYPLHNW